jgi:hypothetical protein
VELLLAAVAQHGDAHARARRRGGDPVAQHVAVGHGIAVDRDDDVALAHAGPRRGPARHHRVHDRAARLAQAEASRHVRGHRLDADAELAAAHAPRAHELVHDVPRHVRRDREPDADAAARRRQDLRVDADPLPRRVHERAAGVAAVDRRVGLEKVFEAPVAEPRRAALGAHDPGGDRLPDAERIADGEHDVADPHPVRVTERERRQPRAVDAQHREVARRIRPDDPRAEGAPVDELDLDLLGAVDDVMVREHVAVGAHEHAAAEPALDARRLRRRPGRAEEVAEERVVQERVLLRRAGAALRAHRDHRGRDPLDDVGVGLDGAARRAGGLGEGDSGGATLGRRARGHGEDHRGENDQGFHGASEG